MAAAAVAVGALAGASAFAETRHREETHRLAESRDSIRREGAGARQESARRDESRNEARGNSERRRGGDDSTWRDSRRSAERRAETDRDNGRRDGDRNSGTYRRDETYDNQHRSYGRNDSYRNNRGYSSSRQPYYYRGPVTSYRRQGNGYHVWLRGARYPFFVPLAYWNPGRFRIGVEINLGGYYNPGGYYDYYDGYAYRSTSRGDLRGTVESVDYRRDTFVIRNDATGSFVTVIARDRRARDVRPGDYVELSGSWSRAGLFSAYDVDLLDGDRY
ncbi:MAG TPA: hypothetical protein VND45_13445, partial [Thermoanaerobaculia bacterium]|nr:hypothetical protein [Thermoanaerobaculia bacterium]